MRKLLNSANAPLEVVKKRLDFDPDTGMFRRRWANGKVSEWFKGSKRSNGYRAVVVAGKSMLAHRVAYAIFFGIYPDGLIDHINGDRSDNRIGNLRVVDHAENMKNRKVELKEKKKFKGCYFDRHKKKWRAAARINSKIYRIGDFDDQTSAHEAYLSFIKSHELSS
ncbi:MAG TPA: HNH endonuclease [Pantoea sp.]|uniref:HNH endonuclease n=1 Tax=Pantoea septica TaxID=472695 RepID=UPI000EC2BBCE|nr:HNH endonuclease [Pantoea septica]HAK35511.1 HNH endonuclease [Pantoea sp.]